MKPIEEYVRSISDFPEPGIIFRDVTSILQDADGLHLAIDLMQEKLKDVDFDVVVGPEPAHRRDGAQSTRTGIKRIYLWCTDRI